MNPSISVSPLIFYYYCSVYGARTKTWSVIEYIICQPRKPRSCYSISFILAKLCGFDRMIKKGPADPVDICVTYVI